MPVSANDQKQGLEEFNLEHRPEISGANIHARPGGVLVAVRDYNRLTHLRRVSAKDESAPARYRRHDGSAAPLRYR